MQSDLRSRCLPMDLGQSLTCSAVCVVAEKAAFPNQEETCEGQSLSQEIHGLGPAPIPAALESAASAGKATPARKGLQMTRGTSGWEQKHTVPLQTHASESTRTRELQLQTPLSNKLTRMYNQRSLHPAPAEIHPLSRYRACSRRLSCSRQSALLSST